MPDFNSGQESAGSEHALAYEMNGEIAAPIFPLRAVVPGWK
jgi:DMSO/TMAO reductase YedYZ molybdopterin-dependent catalytic subunit